MTRRLPAALGLALALALLAPGCVRRTVTITSEPEGALVWLNGREIGRTPAAADFLHYGDYDVRLELEGYEPLVAIGRARAPAWDWPGPDLVAELLPAELHSEVRWHYELEPSRRDPAALVDRAGALRAATIASTPGEPSPVDPGEAAAGDQPAGDAAAPAAGDAPGG